MTSKISNATQAVTNKTSREKNAQQLVEAVAAGAILIDIRNESERLSGSVPGALHVPAQKLAEWIKQNSVELDAVIILVCKSGERAANTNRVLLNSGYMNAFTLAGGIASWIDSGYQLDTEYLEGKEIYSRYARQIMLEGVGIEGQRRLLDSKVLIVGAGGLGCPCILYLAAAGIGKLGIADHDVVDLTNLHRQVLYNQDDVGLQKARVAEKKVLQLNSQVDTEIYLDRINSENAELIFQHYDIVVDCTDNFTARYTISDACVSLNIPLVHGAVFKYQGSVGVFNAVKGACYRCLYPSPPPIELSPSCSDAGVIGILPGLIGTLQAQEVLKSILFISEQDQSVFLKYDVMSSSLSKLEISPRPGCSCQRRY